MYYQLNIDYIIETYCINKDKPELQCNGKCHLTKQLQISNDIPLDEQLSFNLVYEAFYPLFFQISKQEKLLDVFPLDTLIRWNYKNNLEHLFLYKCFQPPEFTS